MMESLLIANRGEIACRIIRTARQLGIRTIAVYSDADATALHVRSADEAVHIGAAPARESYLSADRIIAAARQTHAAAIHPGYGFLSENTAFAQSVLDAGLIWVGPKPSSIAAMGLKDSAKMLMQDAGVPVTPGYLGDNQSPERLQAEADTVGYPLLIKAIAGGGGKGMRKVDARGDFSDALTSCKREAASSFGDDRVLLEKWINNPRHIEVQVFGDTRGNMVHLFERDCSLQRRHQKVLEEAPAPGMTEATRAAICAAAINAAKAVDYIGAGTVEFIADGSEGLRPDRMWFMEMNTRLQVEHPVTEAISGVDLVEWQLRVASGEPLPRRQDELTINGWAMEARIYAEDPRKDFLPSTGTLDTLKFGGSCRIDTGVGTGDEVSSFYDPMIAKVIAHGADRDAARMTLATALRQTAIWPVKTNTGFLAKLIERPEFAAAHFDTGLIARSGDTLMPSAQPDDAALAIAAASVSGSGPLAGFRLNAPPHRGGIFLLDGQPVTVDFVPHHHAQPPRQDILIAREGQVWELTPWRADGTSAVEALNGSILSPMPGRVIVVNVSAGQQVTKGQKLLALEAMKMEYSLEAPFDGTIAEFNVHTGMQVDEGTLLLRVNKTDAD